MDFSSITGFVTKAATDTASNLTSITSPGTTGNPTDMLGLIAVFAVMFLIVFLIIFILVILLIVALYVYSSWALMDIAKRAKVANPWLAWIPIANTYLLTKIAKMPWWPMLFIIPYFIGLILLFIFSIVGIIFYLIGMLFMIAFVVFVFIWWWKTFERVGRPGWWILLALIPFAGIIIFMVFLGIAAWGKLPQNVKKKKR